MTDQHHSQDGESSSDEDEEQEDRHVPPYATAKIDGDDWQLGWAIFAAQDYGLNGLYKALVKSKDSVIAATLKDEGALADLKQALADGDDDEGDADAEQAKSGAAGMKEILTRINAANEKTGDEQVKDVNDKLAELAVELEGYIGKTDVLQQVSIYDTYASKITSLGEFVLDRLAQGGCNNVFYDSVASTVDAVAQHGPSIAVAIRHRVTEAGVTL